MYSFKYEIYMNDGSVISDFAEEICFINGFVYSHGNTISVYDIESVVMKWVDVDELS